MLKRLIKDSGIYGISGVVTRGISIFLVPFYTRVFSPSDYGIIDLITIFSVVLTLFIGLEIYQAIARYYFECETLHKKREYVSTAFFWILFSFGTIFLIMQIFAAPLSKILLQNRAYENILRAAALSISLSGLFNFSLDVLRYRFEPKSHAVCSLLFALTSIGLTVLFVLMFHSGIIGIYLAQSIAALISLSLSFYLARSSYRMYFSFSILKQMMAFSLPLVPSSFAVYVLLYIDRITIRGLMGLSDLGIYGIGCRFASILQLVMVAMNMALTPLIYSRFKDSGTPKEIGKLFRYFVFGALLIITFISIFSKELLIVLTTPAYYSASTVIPFLAASSFISTMYNFAPGLPIKKKTKHIAIIYVLGACVNVALNLLFIPFLGIMGAAIATFISSSFVFSMNLYYSQKNYYVPHNLLILLLAVLITAGIIILGININTNYMSLNIALKLLTLFILFVILFMIRLIDFHIVKIQITKVLSSIYNYCNKRSY